MGDIDTDTEERNYAEELAELRRNIEQATEDHATVENDLRSALEQERINTETQARIQGDLRDQAEQAQETRFNALTTRAEAEFATLRDDFAARTAAHNRELNESQAQLRTVLADPTQAIHHISSNMVAIAEALQRVQLTNSTSNIQMMQVLTRLVSRGDEENPRIDTKGMPLLAEDCIAGEDAVVFVIKISQWFRENNLGDLVIGASDRNDCPTGDFTTVYRNSEKYTTASDGKGKKYMTTAVLNGDIRSLLSKLENGPQCWKKIFDILLGGQNMQYSINNIFESLVQTSSVALGLFYPRFVMITNHLVPPRSQRLLCDDFTTRLLPNYSIIINMANSIIGKSNFPKYADYIVENAAQMVSRDDAYSKKSGIPTDTHGLLTTQSHTAAFTAMRGARQNGNRDVPSLSTSAGEAGPIYNARAWAEPFTAHVNQNTRGGPTAGQSAITREAFITEVGKAVGKVVSNVFNGDSCGACEDSTSTFPSYATSARPGNKSTPGQFAVKCINCNSPEHRTKDCKAKPSNCDHPFCRQKGLDMHHSDNCFYKNPKIIRSEAVRKRVEQELASGKPVMPGALIVTQDSQMLKTLGALHVAQDGQEFYLDTDGSDWTAMLCTTNDLPQTTSSGGLGGLCTDIALDLKGSDFEHLLTLQAAATSQASAVPTLSLGGQAAGLAISAVKDANSEDVPARDTSEGLANDLDGSLGFDLSAPTAFAKPETLSHLTPSPPPSPPPAGGEGSTDGGRISPPPDDSQVSELPSVSTESSPPPSFPPSPPGTPPVTFTPIRADNVEPISIPTGVPVPPLTTAVNVAEVELSFDGTSAIFLAIGPNRFVYILGGCENFGNTERRFAFGPPSEKPKVTDVDSRGTMERGAGEELGQAFRDMMSRRGNYEPLLDMYGTRFFIAIVPPEFMNEPSAPLQSTPELSEIAWFPLHILGDGRGRRKVKDISGKERMCSAFFVGVARRVQALLCNEDKDEQRYGHRGRPPIDFVVPYVVTPVEPIDPELHYDNNLNASLWQAECASRAAHAAFVADDGIADVDAPFVPRVVVSTPPVSDELRAIREQKAREDALQNSVQSETLSLICGCTVGECSRRVNAGDLFCDTSGDHPGCDTCGATWGNHGCRCHDENCRGKYCDGIL